MYGITVPASQEAGVFSQAGSRRRSVSDDWIRALPGDKGPTFDSVVGNWECAYAMMSVSLDDALSLRARGEVVCAREQVDVTAELFVRISSQLISFCEIVTVYSRHIQSYPVVEPLNTQFFRGNTCQQAAFWNRILHRVLFGDRSRFHHKLRILSDSLRHLYREFRRASGSISAGEALQRTESWKDLDCIHYDLNTCLRESEVLLKSFLRALPSEYVLSFGRDLGAALPETGVAAQARLSGASA